MSVGDVLFTAPTSRPTASTSPRAVPDLAAAHRPAVAAGLGTPIGLRHGLGPPLHYSQIDEVALAQPPGRGRSATGVSVFPVQDAPSIVRAESADAPLVVSGDGEGLVDLAASVRLDAPQRRALLRPRSRATSPALRREIAQPGSVLVVTDSNRKRGRRWGAIRDIEGPTERVDEAALTTDEGDARLDLFPGAGADAHDGRRVARTPR